MPVINSIAGFADEMRGWRRHLHQHPELGLDCHKTAEYVVDRLREFGITEIHTGIAQSGVVARAQLLARHVVKSSATALESASDDRPND